MITLVRCINGHEWQPGEATGHTSACPVCGAERTLITPPSHPDPVPALSAESRSAQPVPALTTYEVLEELGQGGMGIVYKARHRGTGRVVAIKVLRKERLGSPDLMNRFRREALAAARLQHPNIVQVVETALEEDPPYLVLEYVPGVTLQKLVEQSGPLSLAQACDFVRQTALALQHAAEQRLVHRDIKPSNLMVIPAAPGSTARAVIKILDMGVARLFQGSDQEASLTTLTRDGSVIGTPDYIAPEQLEDPRSVDVRADLYSLGCTFYFLLTGEVPFPGGSLVQKLDRQRWHVPPAVNQLRSDAPAAMAAVVRRLLAKHPDDRYQTPGELASALEVLLRTGELPGGHHTVSLTSLRILRGHRGPVSCLGFLPGGKLLVSGGADRTLRLWEVETGAERSRFGGDRQAISCLAVTATGLVVAGHGVTLRGWDPHTGQQLFGLSGHTDTVRCLALAPDGKRMLSGGEDRTVRLWDIERGRELLRLSKHRDGVTGVAWAAQGRYALSSSRDQTIRLWDLTNGQEIRSFPTPRGPVLCLALSPEGTTALSGHFDTTLRLWNLENGREIRRLSGHRQMVVALRFLDDGRVFSGSHDQTVRLWDTASGAELASCPGHDRAVTALDVDCDGSWLATADATGLIRLWQLPS
ncbi:MAG: serine/threonine-protein kinase [Gemmataceae bacterium]